MSTFGELADQTLLQLYGFTTLQDQSTYLRANISTADVSLPVADAGAISRGVVEVGDELMWVDSVDTQQGLALLPPYGRGYRGTAAESHSLGDRVTSSPMFPRSAVKRALNESIRAVFPDLFAVDSATIMFNPAVSTYALPAGALDVLAVSWQSVGPSREWLPVRRYRVDKNAATSAFSTGVTVSLYDAIVPGRSVRVVFTKQPTVMAADGDDFVTVSGLPASTEDVIRLGAAYRMVPFFDSPQLTGMSAEADFSANQRPVGSSAQLGRFLLQMYQVRLAEETKRLQSLFPARSHYTR